MKNFKYFFEYVLALIHQKEYEDAFNYVISNKYKFSEEEMLNYFYFKKFSEVTLGISGSGGSGICKPNIGTLVAYHLSKILQQENSNCIVIKFGSRHHTSNFGSIDMGEKISNKNFILIDEEDFNKTIQFIKIDPIIKKFIDKTYITSCYTDKKVVFCKNKEQADYILSKNHVNIKFKFIYSRLLGNEFDEIIPENYNVYVNYSNPIKKSYPHYKEDDYIIEHEKIEKCNCRLLMGNFSGAWGRVLKYSIIETLMFLKEIDFDIAKRIVREYENNIKTLLIFDLDGTLLNTDGNITDHTIQMLKNIENLCDIGVSSGATLPSVIGKMHNYKTKYYMANYGSVLISEEYKEFIFDKNIVIKILNECSFESFLLINELGKTNSIHNVQKIILYTKEHEQFLKYKKEVSIFIYEKYVEIVPLGAKRRTIEYLKKTYKYQNIITVGNDENDLEMFKISDIFYVIDKYEPHLMQFYDKIDLPHENGWTKFEEKIFYLLKKEG